MTPGLAKRGNSNVLAQRQIIRFLTMGYHYFERLLIERDMSLGPLLHGAG